jgi:hypothetical protein
MWSGHDSYSYVALTSYSHMALVDEGRVEGPEQRVEWKGGREEG